MPSSAPTIITATGCTQSIASFAQQRIWFEKQLNHHPSTSPAVNNLLVPLIIKHGTMSIERIRSAVAAILEQHMVLRTVIYFDKKRGKLVQKGQPVVGNSGYSFQLTQNVQSLDEVDVLLKNEFNSHFAQLDRGLVVRCHLIKRGSYDNPENLYPNDLIIFVFHQIAFDYNSIGPFIASLTQAYDQIKPRTTGLQYIDYTLYEYTQVVNAPQHSKMNQAQQFWSKLIDGYYHNEKYLPSMHSTQEIKMHHGRGQSVAFDLDSTLVEAQIEFASVYGLSMFHLGLACYFLFIYGLDNGEMSDLCVACPTDNRSLPEMKSMIGTFINILPYRIKMDTNLCFITFMQQIHRLCTAVHEHAQLPYQQIITDNKNLTSITIPFHFHYDSIDSSSTDETIMKLKTNDATLSLYTDRAWLQGNSVASNNLTFTMIHSPHDRRTHCVFECAMDCYDETTTFEMSRHFQNLLSQLFNRNSTVCGFNQTLQPLAYLSFLTSNIPKSPEDMVQKLPSFIEKSKSFSEVCSKIMFFLSTSTQ